MISDEIRKLIMAQLQDGRRVPELIPIFKSVCKRSTLYSVAKDFAAGVREKPRQQRQPRQGKVTPKMVKRMTFLLTAAKSHNSFRSIAKKLQINESTVRYQMGKRGIKSYKKLKRNLIPKCQKETRRFCCMNFRKTFRKYDLPNFLFVDECYITVKKHFNHQNERCYGKDFSLIRTWKKFREFPKTPLSAMVFGGITRDGRTKLVVLKTGFRINQVSYKKECLIPMLKRMPNKMDPSKTIFYQDKAPCHRADSVQEYLKEVLPSFVRNDAMPPNSPDLNPLDYCIWSLLKEALNKHGHISSFARLKKLLVKEWNTIPQTAIQASVDCWLARVRRVEAADGDHI
jgi:hypothetical protein